MKSIKNLFGLAMGLALGFAAASCSEGVEYNPAEAVAGGQVFFPSTTTDVTLYDLEEGKGSFTVEVQRAVTKGDLNVEVTLEQEGDHTPLVAPATVNFKDGEATAKLEIAYDSEGMEYEEQVAAVLTISDKANTTPYGVSAYEFAAAIPAPWTPWISTKADWVNAGYDPEAWPLSESESTCTYTYVNYWADNDKGLTIYYRQYMLDPTVGQFKIEHWGADSDFFIEYNTVTHACQVLPQYVTNNDNYGPVTIADVSHWQGADYYASYPCTYDPETGKFSLCVAWYVSAGSFGYDPETIQVDGFYIPDYSVSVEFDGVLTDKEQNVFAQIFADWGVDVESVKAYIAQKSDDASAVADALASGDVEGYDVVVGLNKIPVGELTGELKVVLAAIAEGEAVGVAEAAFEYYGAGNANPWKSLGMGLFTDDIVITQYQYADDEGNPHRYDPVTYAVEIKENTETPGLYRVMNPYSNSVYPYAEDDCAPEGLYLEINATDPAFVYVETQSLGFDWGDGEFAFVSEAARMMEAGYDAETLASHGYGGTLSNGKITFPLLESQNGIQYQGVLYFGQQGAYTGRNGAISIVLPEAVTEAAKAKVKAKAAVAKKTSGFKMAKVSKVGRASVGKKMPRTGKFVSFK